MCLPLNNVNLSHRGLESVPDGHGKHHVVFTSFHPSGSAALLGQTNQFVSIFVMEWLVMVLPSHFSGAWSVAWTTADWFGRYPALWNFSICKIWVSWGFYMYVFYRYIQWIRHLIFCSIHLWVNIKAIIYSDYKTDKDQIQADTSYRYKLKNPYTHILGQSPAPPSPMLCFSVSCYWFNEEFEIVWRP